MDNQIETYIIHMRFGKEFTTQRGWTTCWKDMEKGYCVSISLFIGDIFVYSVSYDIYYWKIFSTINDVKNHLCNWVGDQLINDCLVMCIEKDIFQNL